MCPELTEQRQADAPERMMASSLGEITLNADEARMLDEEYSALDAPPRGVPRRPA